MCWVEECNLFWTGLHSPKRTQVHTLEVLLDLALSKGPGGRSAFYKLQPYLEKSDLVTVIHALLTSKLGDGNVLCIVQKKKKHFEKKWFGNINILPPD